MSLITKDPKAKFRPVPRIERKLAKLVIGCVLPLACVAALLIYNFYVYEQEQVVKNTIVRARLMINSVDRSFASSQASLQALATSRRLAGGDLKGFYDRATEALVTMHVDGIVVVDSDAQLLIATNRPFGAALPRLKNAPLLQRVLETEQPSVSNLYVGPLNGKFIYAVGVPVFEQHKISYLLAATAGAETLKHVLTEQNFPDTWRSTIADSTGTIVTRTHESEKFAGRKVLPTLLRQLGSADEGSYNGNNRDGVPVITVYSKSPSSGWVVAIAMPTSELTSGLRRTMAGLIVATMGALAIGVWFASVISARIVDSIADLGVGAKVVGQRGMPSFARLRFQEAVELGEQLVEAASNLDAAQYDADHDGLTGLANRNLFRVRVATSLARSQRNETGLAVLFIDLDGFKVVNDVNGHAAGDQLLTEVAKRIHGSIRASDFAARLGGDEFAIALTDASITNAAMFAGKLIDEISRPYELGSVVASVSASVGVAAFPETTADVETLLSAADEAMYLAKKAGGRRYSLAS